MIFIKQKILSGIEKLFQEVKLKNNGEVPANLYQIIDIGSNSVKTIIFNKNLKVQAKHFNKDINLASKDNVLDLIKVENVIKMIKSWLKLGELL